MFSCTYTGLVYRIPRLTEVVKSHCGERDGQDQEVWDN